MKRAGLVLLGFASLYAITASGQIWSTDGWTRYRVAAGIVDSGRPVLPPDDRPADFWIVRGRNSDAYSFYGLGQSLALVPFYAAARIFAPRSNDVAVFAASFLNTIVGALLAVTVFGLARQIGHTERVSLGVAAVGGLCTIVWAGAADSSDVLLEACCLAMALLGVARGSATGSSSLMLAGGLAYGFGLVTRISILCALPGLALVWLVRSNRSRVERPRWPLTIAFAAGVLPGVLIFLGYNSWRFGSPWITGYESKPLYWTGASVWRGLATLLVSPGRGLVWYAPVVLAVTYLAPRFYRRAPDLARGLVVIAVSYLWFYSSLSGLGLWGWGPYYLLPLMPAVALVWGEPLAGWSGFSRVSRMILKSLLAVSFVVQLLGVASPWIRTYVRATTARVDFEAAIDWRPEWSLLFNQPANVVHAIATHTLDWWWIRMAARGRTVALAVPVILAATLAISIRMFLRSTHKE